MHNDRMNGYVQWNPCMVEKNSASSGVQSIDPNTLVQQDSFYLFLCFIRQTFSFQNNPENQVLSYKI